jgi:hypothetical protein
MGELLFNTIKEYLETNIEGGRRINDLNKKIIW